MIDEGTIVSIFLVMFYLFTFPLVIVGFVWLMRRWMKRHREKQAFQRVVQSGIRSIDQMDGHQFEYFLGQLLKELGYRSVKGTKRSNDFGADLLMEKEKKIVVQAKRYGYKQRVGIQAIQQVFAAIPFYQAQEAWVVTNSFYTAAARKLAQACGVHLLDRWRLQQFIVNVNPEMTAQKVYENVEPARRNCPLCGSPLVVRSHQENTRRFFGCSSFPNCRHTEPLNTS
ncbi:MULTISPECIES: restriction endonuclease [Bacillaceae]|nr:restriction endonuclease [Salicibibacter kimchii]